MKSKKLLLFEDLNLPQILAAEEDFIIAYKPPRMHSAPLPKADTENSPETLLDFCVKKFPEVYELSGRRIGEGGLIHRLDYETQGLMLLGRSEKGLKSLLNQQEEKKIFKYYSAMAGTPPGAQKLPGFPSKPEARLGSISSAFRPYGEGRKAVRPVLDKGAVYTTELLDKKELAPGIALLEIMIFKGFRHQIRSHLAWLGLPLLNDKLYGGPAHGKGFLALRAFCLSFIDPSSGTELSYSIPILELDML